MQRDSPQNEDNTAYQNQNAYPGLHRQRLHRPIRPAGYPPKQLLGSSAQTAHVSHRRPPAIWRKRVHAVRLTLRKAFREPMPNANQTGIFQERHPLGQRRILSALHLQFLTEIHAEPIRHPDVLLDNFVRKAPSPDNLFALWERTRPLSYKAASFSSGFAGTSSCLISDCEFSSNQYCINASAYPSMIKRTFRYV